MSPRGFGWVWTILLAMVVACAGCGSSKAGEPLDDEADVQLLFETIAPDIALLLAERLTMFQQKGYPDCPGGGTLWVDSAGTSVNLTRCTMGGITMDGKTTSFMVGEAPVAIVTLGGTFAISGSLSGTLAVDNAIFSGEDGRLCWSTTGTVEGGPPFDVQSQDQSCDQE
jgi:hypothetical protein